MDHFWKEIGKEVGLVPKNIRIVLERTNYIHGGLAFLDDDAIDGIQRDVQQLPKTTGQNEVEWKKILNYYGDLNEFRFSTGERSSLKMIAATIRKNGITKFSRSLLRSEPEQQQQATLTESVKTVRTKIMDFFEKKYS